MTKSGRGEEVAHYMNTRGREMMKCWGRELKKQIEGEERYGYWWEVNGWMKGIGTDCIKIWLYNVSMQLKKIVILFMKYFPTMN